MAFKAEFGHCNVYPSKSRNNKHLSLGRWLSSSLLSYKTIKQGGIPRRYPLSKGDIKRLENVGFECVLHKAVTRRFDERFKALKAEFGHFNVPQSRSSDNNYYSLGRWCHGIRKAYDIMKEGGTSKYYNLSKGDIKRLENVGFEWDPPRKAGTRNV
jgi:hypothetical protein